MPTRHLRKAWSIAAAILLTAVTAPTAAPASHTGDGGGPLVLMACAGTVAATYTPGLTYVPKPTAVSSQAEVGCPVSAGSRLTRATFGGSSSGTLSCLLGPASGTLTFHWDKGKTSTAAIRSVVAARPNGNVVTASTGRITSGVFTGALVVTEVTLLASGLTDCLTPKGLSSASGPTTVTITRAGAPGAA
ncbi:hypothetical protein FGW37_00670 [Streptomyces rectiverticillatus]|uniref:hypothetical protein n=1 Tax=Streptomyces rectiverticillatus TaxID=173860 RepID=UPI0015C390FB|nr:hypothetical protein [Streptomyces rectiverticillatus]QLE70316.1 hypothetical protein FGW37_00670 [Streptomyces rectiverticillatus]